MMFMYRIQYHLYNKAVFNILNLFLLFVLSPDFKRDVIDQEVGCGDAITSAMTLV